MEKTNFSFIQYFNKLLKHINSGTTSSSIQTENELNLNNFIFENPLQLYLQLNQYLTYLNKLKHVLHELVYPSITPDTVIHSNQTKSSLMKKTTRYTPPVSKKILIETLEKYGIEKEKMDKIIEELYINRIKNRDILKIVPDKTREEKTNIKIKSDEK